ncbi:hypothetical protein DFH07DRAFT_846816 [Mycena maculata]|uniref:histidine kinase n=1 Tax=Mycena maculata TaxID=230809 RepID=A0AAD7I015_9AGAR|nr:hypothetical protein DFH07DRAFT_846816 [Mycena maculata]
MPGKASETTPDEDVDALAQWTLFLQEYRKGKERPPPPPLRSARAVKAAKAATSVPPVVPTYPPGEISPATARAIAEFYDEYGFLPPPRADEETVRRQTIQEFNLFRPDQAENFHRCSSLVNSFFQFAPVCTISLFHNDVQVVVSKAGEFPLPIGIPATSTETEGEALALETSICAHVVLKKKGETVELNELAGDWRFTGNPLCAADSKGVKGYIGVPLSLEVDPSNPDNSERVTVGVLALMSNRPFLRLSATQLKVLDDLSTMLSVQLRSTWESWQRTKETRLRNAVSLFLEKALVEPSQQALMDAEAAAPPVQGAEPGATAKAVDMKVLTSGLLSNASKQLQELLEVDFAIVIDLGSFHATKLNDRRERSHTWVVDGQESQTKARLSKGILGSSSSEAYSGYEKKFNTPEAMAAIANFLDMYVITGRSSFSGSGSFSGLETLLTLSPTSPSSVTGSPGSGLPGAIPHLALPIYSSHRPNLLIVLASAAPFFSFKPSDVTFVSNVGLVLAARLAQNAIVEADAAKTAFVSQISHELRTPLHGLLGQLDLLRDAFASREFSAVPSLLDCAEYCGAALRDIADNVLDFGKMAQASRDGVDTSVAPQHVLVDLAQITLETSRDCWLRQVQWQLASGSMASPALGPSPSVELLVEYEDRAMLKNWWMSLDVTGFKRILNTLVGNSLKYTSQGLITVSLTSGRGPDSTPAGGAQYITLRVDDTGSGIEPEFLDKIFDPFTQADTFSPGAGLGLHICKSVVDRMHGVITVESRPGGGSSFSVVLPVEDIELGVAGSPRAMRRTFVSAHAISKLEINPLPSPPLSSPSLSEPNSAETVTSIHTDTAPLPQTANAAEVDEQHLKILVVDDNAISRKILIRMLKKSNVTAYEADDGVNALEVFREVHPHVVWTDVSMPRMDGVTAAREMRTIERDQGWTPSHIVAITGLGLSDEYIRREALLGPAALDGWLIKGQTNLTSLKDDLAAVRRKLSSISVP